MSALPHAQAAQRTSRVTTRRLTGATVEGSDREKDDFYATDPEATEALLRAERFPHRIWEPACGNGAIVKVLAAHGHEVVATDLVERGHGIARRDFLMEREAPARCIVTNPPFKLADQFIRHALETLGCRKMALFLRLSFYSARRVLPGETKGLLDIHPPARVHALTWRAKTLRGGDPTINAGLIDFAWFVWEAGHVGQTELHRMWKSA